MTFKFRIFQARDNSTLTEVLDAIHAKEGSKVAEIFELGGGR